jgi:hypothetical protein
MQTQPQSDRELWAAFAACTLITLVYLLVAILWHTLPAASGLFGHGLGIVGFILMLMTETLYSLRKRTRDARWGRMSDWMQFHIFTGLVGPYMVLLHTSWQLHGLAGVLVLLTVIIVGSGFVGRYIYTAVPRTPDGVVLEAFELQDQLTAVEQELARWSTAQPEAAAALRNMLVTEGAVGGLGVGAMAADWINRWQWQNQMRRIAPALRPQAKHLRQIVRRRRALRRQVASMEMARRLLSVWHAAHVPLGITLFIAAFLHVAAALYYATLLYY